MTKTIVQMIFEQHATDSLRKTLAEVERAAAGKLHNESLSDYITRLASIKYDAERTNRELDAYREENQRHYAISAENGRVDEEPVEDYMVRVWHSLGVAQRFAEDMKAKLQAEEGRYSKLLSDTTEKLLGSAARIDSLEKQLGEVRKCARKHGWNEVYGWTDEASLCDFIKTALDVSQPVMDALRAQVEDLKAGEAESKAAAEVYGVLPDETHAQFIKRVLGDLATAKEEARRERERANRINAEAEENMQKLWKCANNLGRKDYESLWSFMDRQAAEIGKLNSTHSDDIARIDGLSARLAEIAAEASECGAEEGESVIDFLKRQDAEIEKEGTRAFEAGESLKMWKQDAQDKGQELLKVRAWHEEKLQKIREIEGDNARLQSAIKESCEIAAANGRTESESLGWFIDRICAESKRKDQTVARLQKVLTAIHGAAKAGGLKHGEKIGAFIERFNEEMYKLRCDAASESLKIGNANKRLQNAYDEADEERKVSKRFHALAVKERNNANEEVGKLSKELSLVTKQLQSGQVCWDTYAQLCKFATSCGMTGDESVKQFIERKIIEATTVTADRDRIRAELAAILAEANKSGRCSGDPVALIRQGQVDADAVIYLQRDHARLDVLVSQLQAEINNEKADIAVLERQLDSSAQRVAKTTDEYAALQDRASQAANELSEAQLRAARLSSDLEAILKTANDRGRAIGESVSSFIERLVVNNAELRKARDGYQPVELELRKVQTLMVRIEANTARAGRADGEDLVDFIWRQQHEKGLAREQSAKEIARLSELVAGLQVELDEAKGQYSGIMVQLGNETPLQLIERMQRLAADQRASTIPHDERAVLVGEIADIQKRLEKSQRDHAEVAHELNAARNGANECGMQSGEKLRAFIYRKRAELLDALHSKDRIQLLANENVAKLRAALETVESQSAAIAEAQQVTEKYTAAVAAAAKLRDWASTVRHKVMVKVVHDKAMAEYDTIIEELDGKAGTDAKVPQ